jgi:hypothetical protein
LEKKETLALARVTATLGTCLAQTAKAATVEPVVLAARAIHGTQLDELTFGHVGQSCSPIAADAGFPSLFPC